MDFNYLTGQLKSLNRDLSASELHGLVSGWLCAGARQSDIIQSTGMTDWTGAADDSANDLLQALSLHILAALEDMALGFQLFLPDDEVDINVRQQSLSIWCGGFIAGFGLAGRYQEKELQQDVREVMGDLSRVATLKGNIPDNNENESDMTEILEYVRMSALMVFTQCANRTLR